MKKVDYMRPSGIQRIKIKDRTKTPQGLPTFKAMERLLAKEIKNA